MTMTVQAQKETLGFEAEVRQLLDLMIHSLYSNKEIFLRELVSNASDAMDKLRFEALSNQEIYEKDTELAIKISFDKSTRTITVSDNGIGMDRAEIIEQLGTIAKSGTRQFFDSLTGDQAKDARLIGQFGVGFYSSFIVADRVTVTSRRAGLKSEEAVRWDSVGQGQYTVANVEKMSRGTDVVLHLREGEDEFLDGFRLRGILRKYSDHISFPIIMPKEVAPKGIGEEKTGEEAKEEDVNKEPEKEEPTEETVNAATALWVRSRNEITDEEYDGFYKHVAHDFEAPLARLHSHVEGTLEYTILLFIPSQAPFDLWDRHSRHGVKLYVRRVFIMDDAEHLMPTYLRFVRGIIDSNDLPLNISREILQKNKQVESMRSGSVKRVLGLLDGMAKDEPEKYKKFWKEFGHTLKEGIIEDHKNRETIARLLRFWSTHSDSGDKTVSLDNYIERMKEGQEAIYYITGDSIATAKSSPHLEVFRKKDLEVLLLTDEIDEWVINHLMEYEKKPLRSVAKGALDLGELDDKEEKEQTQKADDEYKDLIERIQKALAEKVKEVRITHRLTTSPACLVADEHSMGKHVERLLKSAGQIVPTMRPTMEINPEHPLVQRLKQEADDARISDWSHILFDQALLSEGGLPSDPGAFVQRINKMFLEPGEK
uniref:Chaperone protein HtpG n=1 Tax=Candidatus Kentrum sp. MB TaxID=2138164 RepID=A0A450X0S0_9GAMM|nr:MAG: molecular chaperone HtpG [Candidatus Kentron sp. MB]VFK26513.1 MAG: molecular chaperone HtpG [Candidatus Kentron sp. MB]VFK74563.1 MAG: molecular chaperone HtpG [Candidatus Kentron sp. MB]